MRILRLTALRSYLILSKNIKKSLVAINIGIFLSIFAATAAIISLVIEGKITNLEFDLIELQEEKMNMEKYSEKIPTFLVIGEMDTSKMENDEQLFKFIKTNDLGNKIISKWDLYLPAVYNLTDLKILKEIEVLNDFVTESLYTDTGDPVFGEETNKEYKDLINEFYKYIKNPFSTEEELQYNKLLFHTSYLNLLDEIKNDEHNSLEEGTVFDRYAHMWNLDFFFKRYFLMIEDVMRAYAKWYADDINILNDEIAKLSNLEKNMIFSAFILQLIIFIIIQFFEVSSVALSHKIKGKVKK